MTNGILVNPDLSTRPVSFDDTQLAELLGGSTTEHVAVSFDEGQDGLVAIVNSAPNAGLEEPNAFASLGKNHANTGNSAFFSDPTAAITGPVIVVSGSVDAVSDITEAGQEQVEEGLRATANYREDYPQEFQLWHNAAMNLG